MNLCFHLPCLGPTFSCSASRKKPEKHNIKTSRPTNPIGPYPKSSPTPLLPARKTLPESRIQALEAVVGQLESAAKNGIVPNDPQIFATLLENCFRLKSLEHGVKIHKLIPAKLLRKNDGVSSKLLRLYACTGQLEKAHELFDQMPERSPFVWNSLISGYVDAGSYEDALALYFQMIEEGVGPDQHTFPRALKACTGLGMVRFGEEIHRHIIKSGFLKTTLVLNALLDTYAKCGDISRARKVFDAIEEKELVSWNSMINGYLKHGLLFQALSFFRQMVREQCEPDPVTLSSILTGGPSHRIGTQVHGWALRRGLDRDLSAANSLIEFYSGRKNLGRVRWLFEHMLEKDVVSWNSVISAHAKDPLALEYFDRMTESNVSPDGITFLSLLSACARLGKVVEGERIFSEMEGKHGVGPATEHYACMVNLYGRAGLIREAYEFIVTRIGAAEAGPTVWGALLYGCYLHGGDPEIGGIAGARLFELEPDVERNFELLIEIYRKVGRDGDAEKVRCMMVERGLGGVGGNELGLGMWA